jgi:hypothetical protein
MDGIYEAPLPPLGYETTTTIVENTSVVVTFAFSRKVLAELYNDGRFFTGTSKALERAFFELPEKKATRAILELALLYRALDDARGLSRSLQKFELGIVYSRGGTAKPLYVREMANKIIHAQKIEWAFADPDAPRLICHAYQNDEMFDWERAEIRVRCIAQACSWLAVVA